MGWWTLTDRDNGESDVGRTPPPGRPYGRWHLVVYVLLRLEIAAALDPWRRFCLVGKTHERGSAVRDFAPYTLS